MKELKEKQHDITLQLEDLTKADENYHITVRTVLSLAQRAEKIFDSAETHEKRQLLQYLIQNPIVDGKTLTYSLRKPFDTISELAINTELRRLDSNQQPTP